MYNEQIISKTFNLPIYYIEKKRVLEDNIITDLELIKCYDESNKPIYHELFNPCDDISKETSKMWVKYYTDDTKFLKDSKSLYKNIKIPCLNDCSKFSETWFEIMNNDDFLCKYHYVDSKYLKSFNTNSKFLTYLSIYNMMSPVLALISPIILLIIPFLILKVRKIPVTISQYKREIGKILGKHPVGNFFKNFNKVGFKKKIYMLSSLGFYGFQMYQNCMSCYRFYKNQKYIHNFFNETKNYINNTVTSMNNYLNYTRNLKTYNPFNENLLKHKTILESYCQRLSSITDMDKKNIHKNVSQIGVLMKEFHRARFDEELENTMTYSLGFNGYYNNIYELKGLIDTNKVNFCKLSNSKMKLNNMIYPSLQNTPGVVKNSVDLNKNLIITGPNAAGKTTAIKTVMLNIIFSQQLSLGFYKNATITPYKYLHCYINIPDTSGRDSLFQAEARRCKEIIEHIEEEPSDNHFCLFDELYSGTNPDEASASAYAFIDYLTKNNNITFVLTTHFIEVCEKLESNDNINNLHMISYMKDNKILYEYKIGKGISKMKGGLEVLKDLNYPAGLINKANSFI